MHGCTRVVVSVGRSSGLGIGVHRYRSTSYCTQPSRCGGHARTVDSRRTLPPPTMWEFDVPEHVPGRRTCTWCTCTETERLNNTVKFDSWTLLQTASHLKTNPDPSFRHWDQLRIGGLATFRAMLRVGTRSHCGDASGKASKTLAMVLVWDACNTCHM